jgi:hypothetical protein
MDPRGFPTTLPEFQQVFPGEPACAGYLEQVRWPDGFVCPRCRWAGAPWRFPNRSSVVLRCRGCEANISLTAGTVMEKTHMPLCTWFWAAYLVTTQTPGMSALQFQRQLGIKRYETAFQMLHKLRAGLVRPDRDTIGGDYPVEMDETFIGGRTRGEGRGVHHKATVVGCVEVREGREGEPQTASRREKHRRGVPLRGKIYAGRMRLRVIPGRGARYLDQFAAENIAKGTVVQTDGWQGYDNLVRLGFRHHPVVVDGDPERIEEHLPMIHIVFSNLKAWLKGTHHGVSQLHLQAYLNEYVYRFNRRFYPMTAFNSALGLAAHSAAPTYDDLYSGRWRHVGN